MGFDSTSRAEGLHHKANSLCSSWCLRRKGNEIIGLGVVVAEPAPGTYLVEKRDLLDPPNAGHQELVTLDAMREAGWRFFDNSEDALNAYKRIVKQGAQS
jgi:hypothetical protein